MGGRGDKAEGHWGRLPGVNAGRHSGKPTNQKTGPGVRLHKGCSFKLSVTALARRDDGAQAAGKPGTANGSGSAHRRAESAPPPRPAPRSPPARATAKGGRLHSPAPDPGPSVSPSTEAMPARRLPRKAERAARRPHTLCPGMDAERSREPAAGIGPEEGMGGVARGSSFGGGGARGSAGAWGRAGLRPWGGSGGGAPLWQGRSPALAGEGARLLP